MWDVSIDEDELIKEFITLYYGSGARAVQRHIDRVTDASVASGKTPTCYGSGDPPFPNPRANYASYFGYENLDPMVSIQEIESAIDRAADIDCRKSLRKLLISTYSWAIEPAWHISQPRELSAGLRKIYLPLVGRFFQLADEYNVQFESWSHDLAQLSWHPDFFEEEPARVRLSRVFSNQF